MGDYYDYNMHVPHQEQLAAGICHTRGVNAEMPAQWMVYIHVDDLEKSLETCLALGGELIADRRQSDGSGFLVIRDPAGAYSALYCPQATRQG